MIVEKRASSLAEFIERVKEIREAWNPGQKDPEELWYRGQSRRDHVLIPGLYRPESLKAKFDEETLLERFKAQAASYSGVPPWDRDWEWYFLAQHYGLPTRLLDWTENALTALFFALWRLVERGGKAAFVASCEAPQLEPTYGPESPAVWMLDAGTLNKPVFGSGYDAVMVPEGKWARNWLELSKSPANFKWKKSTASNNRPIAILAPRKSPRILAQQGTFTVHGWDKYSIDHLAAQVDDQIRLACISIASGDVCRTWADMELLGVNELAFFPELENISRQLRWTYEDV